MIDCSSLGLIITVDTIIAHLKARIAAGEAAVKEMVIDHNWMDSTKAIELVRAHTNTYREVLDDIERGVLMTEDSSSQNIHDDIRDSREY